MRAIAYLGNDTLLTMTKYERKIYVDGRDLGIAPHILMQGDWEHWVSAFVQRFLLDWARRMPQKPLLDSERPWVLDVGANVGWYSLLAHFTSEGNFRVKAYEPNPRMAELLRMTFSVNGLPQRHVREVLVGDQPREADQYIRWDCRYPGGGGIEEADVDLNPGEQRTNVTQVILDDEVQEGAAVALIKADVEGCEPAVIAGASRILRENPLCGILIEHNPSQAEYEMLRRLVGEGYQLGWVGYDANLHPKTVDEAMVVSGSEMLFLQRR